ncbi:MAG: sensor histidine kinase [Chitinophagaceae bacterium]|nr:MAG: sensor histidine kinase [Chitinophagaceae bacterium]
MKKLLLYIITVMFFGFNGVAQTVSKKDSLIHALQSAKEDTSRIRLLLNIQNLYSTKNYDSSYYYLDEANKLARKIKSDKFDFYINVGFAEYYYYNNDYKKSLEYALKNKDLAEKENDMKLLAKSYNNLSAIYNHFGQYKSAIDCILKCLDISEKTKDSLSFPIRNLTASNTYFNLKQFDQSIIYAGKAIEFGKTFNNPFAVMMGLNNLSASYSQLNMLDSSTSISKRQLDFAKQQEDIVNINYALLNLCYDNFRSGNIKALENYAKELSEYAKKLPDRQTSAETHNALALSLISQQKYTLAKAELDSGVNIAQKEINADALGNLYRSYSIFYFMQGKIKEGGNYSFKYDSLISTTNLKELNFYTEELETKYSVEKKEEQIKTQQSVIRQKNMLNYVFSISAIILLIALILAWRNYKIRRKIQQQRITELETEKQLAATEAVLKGEEQERTRLAKDLHDGLGGMLSGIKHSLSNMKENLIMTPDNARAFERSIDMLDSSIREMRRVAHNMMPEVLVRYGLNTALKEFCNEIDRSGVINTSYQAIGMDKIEIEQTIAITIYRIVQELVNNSIKHAAAKNVLVQVHAAEQEKLLTVTVEDDGKGFDTAALKQSSGIGWSNIQNRIEFLKGKVDIVSSPGKGSSVLIEINV